VSHLTLSPRLWQSVLGVLLLTGLAIGQDKSPKSEVPPPRVVAQDKKEPSKGPDAPKKELPPKAPEIKKEEPKAPEPTKKAFEPIPKPPEVKKEEPKKEEPKKEEAPESKKEDPLADLKKAVEKADSTAGDAMKHGDNAWILASAALVLLMTPGLALFYGGMVRRKNILATMMQSYASMAVVGLYWVAFGYGLAFGPSQIKLDMFGQTDGGIIGWDWKLFFLQGVNPSSYLPGYNIPILTHVVFQGMFAIITPALISGSVAERIRFWPWTIFMILWITFIYCPLAHMVWAFDWFYIDPATPGKDIGATAVGLLGKMGALDFAGGTVVHIAAGFAGLACLLVLRKRIGYPEHAMHPNSMVITLLGAGLLWFGWFGFNGGSALGSGDLASTGFATTQAAAAAAGLSWMLVEYLHKGKPTALGLASGIVAGLVAVTPAAGFVYMWGGAAIGALAGIICYGSVQVKAMLGYDDSLDAFGVHGVGGFFGAILTGVFCYAAIQGASQDGFFAHRGYQKNIDKLTAEVKSLKEEIPTIEKTEPELKKKADEAAAKADAAKDPKEKETLTKAADEAKLVFEEVAKTVERRKTRIADIEKEDGEIAKYKAKIEAAKKDEKGPMTQTIIQIKASIFSAVFAFVGSLILAVLVQAVTLGNFTTSPKEEGDGLDITEHGEVGFDFGGIDTSLTASPAVPKSAKVPPGGRRYEVIVDGVENGGLIKAWSDLCQPKEGPIDADFNAVYPYVTTVQGNRFRLRGGDPKTTAASLQRLFQKKLGQGIKVRVVE
jgi:Amt family ammonium transporter